MPLEANTFVGLPSALRFMLKALGVTTCIGIGVAKIVDFCSTITAVYVIALSSVSFLSKSAMRSFLYVEHKSVTATILVPTRLTVVRMLQQRSEFEKIRGPKIPRSNAVIIRTPSKALY